MAQARQNSGANRDRLRPGFAATLAHVVGRVPRAKLVLYIRSNVVKMARGSNGRKTKTLAQGSKGRRLQSVAQSRRGLAPATKEGPRPPVWRSARVVFRGNGLKGTSRWDPRTFVARVNDCVARNAKLLSLVANGTDADRWLVLFYEELQVDEAQAMDRVRRHLGLPAAAAAAAEPRVKTARVKKSEDLRAVVKNYDEIEALLRDGPRASPCLLEQLRATSPRVHPLCAPLPPFANADHPARPPP